MMDHKGFGLGMVVWLLCAGAFAFNAAEDTPGPVTLRIEGASKIEERQLPLAVVLANAGSDVAEGTLRIGVIDAWRVAPKGEMPFALGPGEEQRFDFTLSAGAATYNAHYPVHARAAFTSGGAAYEAHAVLIFETQFPDPPQPDKTQVWKAMALPADAQLALWRAPIHRTVIHLFGDERPWAQPVGWQGSEGRTRADVRFDQIAHADTARRAITAHPPWYGGKAGAAVLEFPLQLPEQTPLRLRFANAIGPHYPERNEPPSDGVTCRVRVCALDATAGTLGEVLLDRHTAEYTWQEAEVDLGGYAGQAVRLQLETDPGPKRDTTCDRGLWGTPLLIAGTPPPAAPFPPAADADARMLGKAGASEVCVWLGSRGVLDASIGFKQGDQTLSFHGFQVKVAGEPLEDEHSMCRLLGVEEETAQHDGFRVRHRFEGLRGGFDLVVELWTEGGALRASFELENAPAPKPWSVVRIEDVAAGMWSETAERVYAGVGNVLDTPEAFRLGFDGHQLATSFVGYEFENATALVQAVNVPPARLEVSPEERHYSLHAAHAQTMTCIPCESVWEGVKVWRDLDARPASGGVAELAGRFVFDLWGGRYAETADNLERAFRYGLTDTAVVWHNWQRWGYDYRLPDILPPNPKFGTAAEFRRLGDVCKEHGVLFAPHDNYIDFYPDAAGYSYRHIAFLENRLPIRAWFNQGRDAQSYRWRADAIQPFVERNIVALNEAFAPNAYFIDVFSSVRPYDYWTDDGRFFGCVYTRDTWGETFAWIRKQMGGTAPQISESGHDQLVGWLDGAQANHLRVDPAATGPNAGFTWRIPCADAERIPWIDAAYHERFVLHGAGYDPRYRAGRDAEQHGIYSDDYVCTEVLTGHPAMVPAPFGREVVRKYWLLHDLGRALALARIERVEFVEGDTHRQRVVWDTGGEVWVNRGKGDWNTGQHTLPPFGFYARVPADEGLVEAAIERRGGIIVEWSQSPSGWYVNGRMPASDEARVSVRAGAVRLLEGRDLLLELAWHASAPLMGDLVAFVHGVDSENTIRFQGDHRPAPPTPQWHGAVSTTAHMKLPAGVAPGDRFEIRAGLYDPVTSRRIRLLGKDDGHGGIRLGHIEVQAERQSVAGVSWTPEELLPDAGQERGNPDARMIDFGPVATAGGCRVSFDRGRPTLTPLPNCPPFVVQISREFWSARDLPFPDAVTAHPELGEAAQGVQAEWHEDALWVLCEPDVFAYGL